MKRDREPIAERLRVLIVDDEPPAREKLARLLAAEPGVEVIGEAIDGVEAVRAIASHEPDLVLLDVEMPRLGGFEVLDALEATGQEPRPMVVFVTAYDRFAVRAFDVHAVDYLLKPVIAERLAEALERARAIDRRDEGQRVAGLRRASKEVRAAHPLRRFIVQVGGRLQLVDARNVVWLEAAANYVELHLEGRRHVVRGSLTSIAQRLDPERFARVHRSAVVNLDWVRELRPISHGDYRVILRNGDEVKLSRRYRHELPATLGA
jgi:two-component system, LytTR family, response regulator